MSQSLANVLIFTLTSFTKELQSQNLGDTCIVIFHLANKQNGGMGEGAKLLSLVFLTVSQI